MSIRIGIVKGRSYERAISFINENFKLYPTKRTDSSRDLSFLEEKFVMGPHSFTIKYVTISPRDVGPFLEQNIIDIAVSYDDTLYHLPEKNYHIKPLFPEDSKRSAFVVLAGPQGLDLMSPLIICSEYSDAVRKYSAFDCLSNIQGKWILAHGSAESMVANGLADACVVVVESGETLKANGLVQLRTVRPIRMNAFVNADYPMGETILRHFRPNIQTVYIDGIDGAGKTTLVKALKKHKDLRPFIIKDRGPLTKLTLLDYSDWPEKLEGTHLILDIDPIVALARIACRNRENVTISDSKWETQEALSYFSFKYKELAAHYGLPVLQVCADPQKTEQFAIQTILFPQTMYIFYPKLSTFTQAEFDALTLIAKGESKIIRSFNDKYDIIQYIPSIYSHKKKRAGFIEGSAEERMIMTRYILNLLAWEDIPHTYIYVGQKFILAKKLVSPPPPIEIVVKSRLNGTDKYRYVGLQNYNNRHGFPIVDEKEKYWTPYVRFDWRNDNTHPEGDVAMSETLADNLIDVVRTEKLALKTFKTLNKHFQNFGVELWDICFFITQQGNSLFGEISQDNGRYRAIENNESLDKDVWRAGGSSELVLEKWKELSRLTRNYVREFFEKKF